MTMLEAALSWVQHGFAVFPVRPDKRPITEHGLKDASKDTTQITEWWSKWPIAGIAVPTDGLIVLDCDAKHDGLANKTKLEEKYQPLPPTRTHQTGGGGLHLLYRNPNGSDIRNTVALDGFEGLDIRANGGYIVVPPSMHLSGNRYAVKEACEIAPAPDWLMTLVKARPVTPLGVPAGSEMIPEGQRNQRLAKLAGYMRRQGLTAEVIEVALVEVNKRQCSPPLSDNEVSLIAKSISRYSPDTKTDKTDNLASNTDIVSTGNKENPTKLTKLTNTDISASKTDKAAIGYPVHVQGTKVPGYQGTIVPKYQVPSTLHSTMVDAENLGKAIWKQVDNWIEIHIGERFDLDMICRHLNITNPEARHHVSKKLSYEVANGDLEKVNAYRSVFRKPNPAIKLLDWANAVTSHTYTLEWPKGRDDSTFFPFSHHVTVSPGDIIVLAGVSNTGKTAFCLNLLWENMDDHPCTLMGNEYSPAKFKRRVAPMSWADPVDHETGLPKFELIKRYDEWPDAIRPDGLNIIDWINLTDNFYLIGNIIEGIQAKLKGGIAVISIQKGENKLLGRGGDFSRDLANIYLAIDFRRLTVVKAKEWQTSDPNGKVYGFEIAGTTGTNFRNIRELVKCRGCGGTGRVRSGNCSACDGKGWADY